MSPAAPWVDVVVLDNGHHGVADGGQITGAMIRACTRYLTAGIGFGEQETFRPDSRPIVAESHVRYLTALVTGVEHRSCVRASARSARGFTLAIDLARADDGTPVARGTIRFTCVNPAIGRSVEIPGPLWDAIERLEGRAIPTAP